MLDKEIAIIGSTEVVKPFLVLGIDCRETQDPKKALEILEEIEREQKVGIVFIAESLAEECMEEIEIIKLKALPAIFILPEYGSEKRLALKRLKKTMARAVGKQI
ncbi:V-type ATP synthase subunit F [Candidatus Margulisiibacteriota bacterium]